MIVVAYVYNNNGMATWCTEAAMALQELGQEVVLIKSKEVQLPSNFPVKYIDFDKSYSRPILKKVINKVRNYLQLLPLLPMKEDEFLEDLHSYLIGASLTPTLYLLNQTSLVNNKVRVPQYVVAWAYGIHFKDYLKKAFLLTESVRTLYEYLLFVLYWYKVDWIGYRKATGVLAVSERLKTALVKNGIRAFTIHPGISGEFYTHQVVDATKDGKVQFAMMALDLHDRRKGLKKIINSLKKLDTNLFKLTLIGGTTDKFKEWVLTGGFPATFTGLLGREQATDILNKCDVLLFGSLVDDWGYVQVEAMSRGMIVLSPKASPFDEIIGREDYLYDSKSDEDLQKKLGATLGNPNKINMDKCWFKERYKSRFSANVFANNLFECILRESSTRPK
jgi:hypothetical protein